MLYPDLDSVKKLAEDNNVVPISMEVYADMETPISLFKRFEDSPYCYLLESVEGGEKWARYSFIGRNPFLIVKNQGHRVVIEDCHGDTTVREGNPVEILREIMAQYRGANLPGLPRFNGGAVGFFSYDTIRYFEHLPSIPEDDLNFPECHFIFTDEVIVFDHLKQKIHIIVNLHTAGNIERNYNSVQQRIKDIYYEIQSTRWKTKETRKTETAGGAGELKVTSNITKDKYCENVRIAKEYIRDGDIFQVVLSQRLSVETRQNPLDVYRVLRGMNPSPYMYYLKFKDYCIVGSSPEMLVRVEDRRVETCPIAGTRKRGASEEEDKLLENELQADEKEKAEHIMLVDLGRNDVGKVSHYGSVTASNLMHIEKYSHVMHMVTNVQGELRDDKDAFDALVSILPAGTVSGAPKVRAMEIIDELETTKRGPYAGAIGYLSFNGNLDSCITIRTILFKEDKAYVQAGAGIVADSVPESEYEETLNKAGALLKALEKAGEIR